MTENGQSRSISCPLSVVYVSRMSAKRKRLLRGQLALDVASDQFDREQIAKVRHLGIALETAQVGVGHAVTQLLQTLVGDLAILDEVGIALEDRFREQLAARNLDAELPLETEN